MTFSDILTSAAAAADADDDDAERTYEIHVYTPATTPSASKGTFLQNIKLR